MQIEQAYDKVVLSNDEIQDALRTYVQTRSGRKVRGHIVVNHTTSSERNAVLRAKKEPYCPEVEGAGYCYLEPQADGFNKVA